MPAETRMLTSSTVLPRAQPALTFSLVLPHAACEGSAHRRRVEEGEEDAGRLYFLTSETQQQQQRQDPRSVAEAVRDGVEAAEQRRCALHRVQVAPGSSSADVAAPDGPQTVLYAERVGAFDTAEALRNGGSACEAVLTACPALYEREMSGEQCHEAATIAPLCIFQDVCGGDATRDVFWRFLTSVLRLGIRAGTNTAALAGVRGRVVSAVEGGARRGFCADVFAGDGEAEAAATPGGPSAARVRAVDGAAAVDDVVQHLQAALQRAEQRHGAALLVVEITWRRFKHIRHPTAASSTHVDKRSCLVWLPDAIASSGGDDGDAVYAETALEMLLDELVLAAATTTVPADVESGEAVFAEPGVQELMASCQLTRAIADQLRLSFAQCCVLGRPLFHWVVCAPPSSTSRLDNRVTRRSFATTDGSCGEDFWAAVEGVEHWADVAAVAADLARSAAPAVPPKKHGATATATERPVSPTTLSSSLRERSRVSRQRRAIRQSGHHGQSSPVEGSALARQRRKMNVPKLYGCEESDKPANARGVASLDASLAGSGVFRHTRSSLNSSLSTNSLLDSVDTLGRTTRRTVRLVKRIPKAAAVADDEL